MDNVSLADAKARLSEFVERAEAGDPVTITRRGKPVVQITAIKKMPRPIYVAAMRALTNSMPMQTVSAGDFIRRMRDEDRY